MIYGVYALHTEKKSLGSNHLATKNNHVTMFENNSCYTRIGEQLCCRVLLCIL